jgi:hypothetical protein
MLCEPLLRLLCLSGWVRSRPFGGAFAVRKGLGYLMYHGYPKRQHP